MVLQRVTRLAAVTFLVVAAVVFVGTDPAAAAETSYVVNSTADKSDIAPGDGICRTSESVCTLRAAIQEDRVDGVPTTISFAIPGDAVHTIQLGLNLPPVDDAGGPTVIDGYTQPGAQPNSSSVGSNAVIKVQIRGNGPSGHDVLPIRSSGNVVRGLAVFYANKAFRLDGAGATENVIAGNFIGTDAPALFRTEEFQVGAIGVTLIRGAARNRIGGPDPADRNVISGNGGRGIALFDGGTNDNVIKNNIVGLSPDGTRALPNLGHGIDLNSGVSRTLVGGSGTSDGNVVSGNRGSGIEVSHMTLTRDNRIVGNRIGTDLTGTSTPAFVINGQVNLRNEDGVVGTIVTDNIIGNGPSGAIKIDRSVTGTVLERNHVGAARSGEQLSGGPFGIRVEAASTNIRIGPGNVIAHSDAGIQILNDTTKAVTVTKNSIHSNAGLGIDISPLTSVNQNDAGDLDDGPNDRLNFPELRAASSSSLTGMACAGCTVEAFIADTLSTDPSVKASYGEGMTFMASAIASSSGEFTIPVSEEAWGKALTSTATDGFGNTSEFSRNIAVPDPLIARDSFSRSVVHGWGSAEIGGPYTPRFTWERWNFSVNGSVGLMDVPRARSRAVNLLDISALDVEMAVNVVITRASSGGGQTAALVLRRVDNNMQYRARVRIASDGRVFLAATVGEAVLGAEMLVPGLTYSPWQVLRLQARVTGSDPTTIALKVWKAADPEPDGWQLTVTDATAALQAAGGVGLFAYSGEAESVTSDLRYRFDDLSVRQPE